jgi:lipopolysaccharide biosynthesis protein
MRLISEDPSLTLFFRVIREKLTRPLMLTAQNWIPSDVVGLTGQNIPGSLPKIAITVHLFYEEYVERLQSALERFPFPFDLLITTASDELAEICRNTFAELAENLVVRRVPNRGRNFGPLFVEYSSEFKKYDLVIHVHSKKSSYLEKDVAFQWSTELWDSLISNPEVVRRAVEGFVRDPKIGLYYPFATLIPPATFDWAMSGKIGKEWSCQHKVKHLSGFIPFPAGGMFWFRPRAVEPILESNFDYSDFPDELGQVDATLQHALERLMGTVPLTLGFKHLVYDVKSDSFTTDTSYAGKLISLRKYLKNRASRSAKLSIR